MPVGEGEFIRRYIYALGAETPRERSKHCGGEKEKHVAMSGFLDSNG